MQLDPHISGAKMRPLVDEFMALIANHSVDIYNEFSLQHEFGAFLRLKLPNKRIQFERNVSYFGLAKQDFTKREIDITVFQDQPCSLDFAIELKYPRNGQHPEQMFSFCKDIAFLEELSAAGFANALFLVVADDKLFYSGSCVGIYSFFRGGTPLHGTVTKPTGKKDSKIRITGSYTVSWSNIAGSRRYAQVYPNPKDV